MMFQNKARRKSVHWFVVFVVVCVMLSGSIGTQSQVVLAGSNGQMVRLSNACTNPATITWARVSGYNQNNTFATWQAWPNSASVTTNGWYWVGRVKIEWRTNRDPYLHSTAYDVPRNQPNRDWVAVILDKWGC